MRNLISSLVKLSNGEGFNSDEIDILNKVIRDITPKEDYLRIESEGHIIKPTTGVYNPDDFPYPVIPTAKYIAEYNCNHNDEPTGQEKFNRYKVVGGFHFLPVYNFAETIVEDANQLLFSKCQITSIAQDYLDLFEKDRFANHAFPYKNKDGKLFFFLKQGNSLTFNPHTSVCGPLSYFYLKS
jgi:hypothetical protein